MKDNDEDTGELLGLDLSGNQPKFDESVISLLGHNSEVVIIGRVKSTIESLLKLGEEQEDELQAVVDKQEDEREVLLSVLGKQLKVGRKPFEDEDGKLKSPRVYGDWINNNFPNLLEIVNNVEITAIIWAAEFPEQRQEMMDKYPRVRTTRGAYAKWKEDEKAAKGSGKPPTGGSSGNGGSGKPSGSGSSNPPPPPSFDDENKPNKGKVNTDNPDTTVVNVEATMIASSLIGVVTNMIMFETTKERAVGKEELASAIFDEIRTQSVDQLTEEEVQDFIENKLKRTLNLIMNSLPVLNSFETNVVKLNKTMENF